MPTESDATTQSDPQLVARVRSIWRTLFHIIIDPAKAASLPPSGQSNHIFLLTMLFFCAVAPAMALNGLFTVLDWISPRFWRFNDINPTTIVVVAPMWLLFGLAQAWLLGWCLYGGLRMFGVAEQRDVDLIRRFGWVAGAVVLTLGAWWYGFGVPLYTFADSIELPRWFDQNILTLAMVVIFAISVRIILGGLLAVIDGRRAHILTGGVAGATLFLIGWNILNGIAFGVIGFVAMKVLR